MPFPEITRPGVCPGRNANGLGGIRPIGPTVPAGLHTARTAATAKALALAMAFALTHTLASAQTYLDTATAGEPYRIQGEYAGTVGTKPYGAQVIAWGNGKFEAVMLPGGLPGAGWGSKPTDFKSVTGNTSGSNTVFTTTGWSMVIKAGGAAIEGTGPDGALKMTKVFRESASLNWQGPADAVKLFDGTQATFKANWSSGSIKENAFLSEGSNSKTPFADHTLHLEFREPFEPLGDFQDRGNSGMYVQGRYEVQVLDSFGWMKGTNHGGAEGWAGGIYALKPGDFNMAFPPLRWETYDVWLTNAKFNGTTKTTNARITVWLNGIKVQDDVELPGPTPGNYEGEAATGGKLAMQNHGAPLYFRNIWVVPGKQVPIPATIKIVVPAQRKQPARASIFSADGAPYVDIRGAHRVAAPHGPFLMLSAGEKRQ